MAGQRKIATEREARQCLLRAEAAGIDIGAWARAQGIDGRSLNAWRVNLARRGRALAPSHQSTPQNQLVELVPRTPHSVSPSTARYIVEVAGARVELGDDFSAPTLRRLIEVLRSC